ncbi:MAG: response regulator [Patescibacteria group bacterium]
MADKSKKVLIIEDEKIVSDIYKTKLEKEGFFISQAFDGQTGLDMALQEKPDLIILDIILPKLNGVAVLDKLQMDSWGSTVPVLIATNMPEDPKLQRTAKGKLYEIVAKVDISPNDLVKKVKEKIIR